MKGIFLSFIVTLFVLGCSKNLPTDATETRGSKDITIVFSGETVESPQFGSNINPPWNMVDMTVTSETSAKITVSVVRGKTYRVNVEYSPEKWAADAAGIHGKTTVDEKELTETEDNGLGGKSFLLSVE